LQFQRTSITTSRKVNGNSKEEGGGGGGGSQAKIFKGKYETKLEFSGSGRGMVIF